MAVGDQTRALADRFKAAGFPATVSVSTDDIFEHEDERVPLVIWQQTWAHWFKVGRLGGDLDQWVPFPDDATAEVAERMQIDDLLESMELALTRWLEVIQAERARS